MPPSPEELESSDNDDGLDTGLVERLCKLSVVPQPYRYHGKSSGLVLIRSAIGLRNQHLGISGQVEPQEKIPHEFPVRHFVEHGRCVTLTNLYQVAHAPESRAVARLRPGRLPARGPLGLSGRPVLPQSKRRISDLP